MYCQAILQLTAHMHVLQKDILRKEGAGALFKGGLVRAVWTAPQGAMNFAGGLSRCTVLRCASRPKQHAAQPRIACVAPHMPSYFYRDSESIAMAGLGDMRFHEGSRMRP